ncbi:DUF3243 domain-containing protein [Kyrpidia spormannii]|uniref:DUF3243 domain-containing protein n=1 Tax=Kyrpidia spormannii TaxID=2055160 RepID=A0A2K8N8B7_9BACL|nr:MULTISPECIES: DUF3243 domain-containing protein [Kyrpidia]ATY85589.1 DUF3243 domain-containing protein [Kyrpidia spormannii]MCL6574832.1 DUF3243 domain-containing protein [Kyrpidia sp.]CAB3394890.1 conserved protein of unknown function [Kyrpidia spormannii]HHY65988.1 DUF3243 domain-containing protein [Alicyclobacillus sp.]
MHVLENFEQWKNFLGDRVDQAQAAGMSTEQIQQIAYRMGDFLARQVDPQNKQERLLQEMWKVSSEQDQQALARIMVNLVNKS